MSFEGGRPTHGDEQEKKLGFLKEVFLPMAESQMQEQREARF